MLDIWNTVHKERVILIRDLVDLPPEAWTTMSLCEGWTIHDVLAHLVHDAKTTKLSFVIDLIRARFNFDAANQHGMERERQTTAADTLVAFEEVAHRTTSAPAPLASRLVEIIVHGEDIRRPLGLYHTYPMSAVLQALEYQLKTSASTGGSKERAEGLQLVATDVDWSRGTGSRVRGTAIDLLLALTGRSQGTQNLIGEGVDTLRR